MVNIKYALRVPVLLVFENRKIRNCKVADFFSIQKLAIQNLSSFFQDPSGLCCHNDIRLINTKKSISNFNLFQTLKVKRNMFQVITTKPLWTNWTISSYAISQKFWCRSQDDNTSLQQPYYEFDLSNFDLVDFPFVSMQRLKGISPIAFINPIHINFISTSCLNFLSALSREIINDKTIRTWSLLPCF